MGPSRVTSARTSFGHTLEDSVDLLVDSLAVHALKSEQADDVESEEDNWSLMKTEGVASSAGKPKSDWLLLHEGELILKLQDIGHVFSVDELCRLSNVVFSMPSRCYKNLEGIRDALLYHPKLADFQKAFKMPCMRTRAPDGSVGVNRVRTASRHGRLAKAICQALGVVIKSRRAAILSVVGSSSFVNGKDWLLSSQHCWPRKELLCCSRLVGSWLAQGGGLMNLTAALNKWLHLALAGLGAIWAFLW